MDFDYSKIEQEVLDLLNELLEFNENREDSVERVKLIKQSFELAYNAHIGVKRKSGEPYIIHPLHVALIVAKEMGLGVKSIVAAILHDVVEDTDYTVEDIEDLFGKNIADMVDGLTKLSDVFYLDRSIQAENFKKLLLTLNNDIRVILIKIADRLHNMRTMASMPEKKQIKIASETLYLFAPLAQRMGLYAIKTELEDLSFEYRHPEIHKELINQLELFKQSNQIFIDRFVSKIQEKLDKSGFNAKVEVVYKTPPSIYRKIKLNKISFNEIHDLFLVRIVFEPNPDQQEKIQYWNIYSTITDVASPRPERIRDLLSNPKTNGYQALHATVIGEGGRPIEIQIRSHDMHKIAENGYVSYWKEKGLKSQDSVINQWLEEVREELDSAKDAMEFVEEFKTNLFSQEIRVFTHKGHLKKLPKYSTVIDFAYMIHSDLGNHCIGAKVNHKLVGRGYVLKQGDHIEILTADNQEPQADWLQISITAKAKTGIKAGIKAHRRRFIQDGKNILEQILKELKTGLDRPEFIDMLNHYRLQHKDDLYYTIGINEISEEDLSKFLKRKGRRRIIRYWQVQLGFGKKVGEDEVLDKKKTLILDDSLTNPNFNLASCCNPIPGDDVIGFLGDNNITQIHKKDCPIATDLLSHQGDKLISVQWKTLRMMSFQASIKLSGMDNLGLVGNITRIISVESKVNMKAIRFETDNGLFEGEIDLYIHNSQDLNNLILKLSKIKGVDRIERIS